MTTTANRNTKENKASRLGWFSIAALILLIASAMANFYFYSEYNSLRHEQSLLITENEEVLKRVEELENKLSVIRNPAMKAVPMSPVGNHQAKATIYWNIISHELYILTHNLPKPAPDKEYQLWAYIDGKPSDAGVFEAGSQELLTKMREIEAAESFVVTLEKKGGSETPDLSAIIVKGDL